MIYDAEAAALFERFTVKHGLEYEVTEDAPIEVLWTIPVQNGVTYPITLGLQNNDELNFGVSDFWSCFFPFNRVAADFERYIDAWIIGEARVAITGPWGRVLQIWTGETWKSVYGANRVLPLWRKPRRVVHNRPLADPC